ncbi:MlaD family protein [Mycolicibacterium septicum]|uniref:MlaD family protein n=1 Tax=Mycolicibacterium septicum TaxID=98668 RepID=UPI0023629DF7|nr:MlaD family protein [Mycolicibacterium septicum]
MSSCGSLNAKVLPQPGNTYRDGYDIIVEFDSALNLPDRAKVMLDGTTIGVVTNVAGTARQVDVTARIGPDVVLTSKMHATLQQATVLGDIYVAIERPPADDTGAQPLRPGGRIPLARTTSPPPLEDTIASLANFVSSGSIQRIQNTIVGINRVAPTGEDAIKKLASQVSADLAGLSNNIDTVDQWLNGASGTVQVMHDRIPDFQEWFSEKGMKGWDRVTNITVYIGTLFPSLGTIYSGGYWLGPLINSLGDALGAVQQSKWNFEGEWPAWRKLFTGVFLPEFKHPAINITSIVGPDGRELSGSAQEVLRTIGAMP